MKFKEYVETQCKTIGKNYWNSWTNSVHPINTAIKLPMKNYNLVQLKNWCNDYCQGRVVVLSTWILFEFEDDSILFALRWI